MRSKNRFTQISIRLLSSVLLAVALFSFAAPVHAQRADSTQSDLNTFIASVKNEKPDVLRGVYILNVMSFPIVQQPEQDSGFVSTKPSVVTQFAMAARAGNIGLLAHSNLAGQSFTGIVEDDQIVLVYGDGRIETFVVTGVLLYQIVARGVYKDLETHQTFRTGEVFDIAYGGEYHVALQTCIENESDPLWGRMFIIARPVIAVQQNRLSY